MKQFEIVTDSSCDLSAAMVQSLGVTIVPLTVNIGDKSYHDYPDEREITHKEVFRLLRTSVSANTAAPNIDQFKAAMEPFLQAGRDVLLLSFSGVLSSTHDYGASAARELAEQYPERVIRVIDTKSGSLGQGLLVTSCANLADAGKSLDEVVAFAEKSLPHVNHWVTCDTLHRLRMGGRISATSALFGDLLSIKPIMSLNGGGRLASTGKVRGRNAAIAALADKVAECIEDPAGQTIFISHGDCMEDVEKLIARIKEKVTVKGFEVNYIGPVIAAHAGAGALAVFFYGKER